MSSLPFSTSADRNKEVIGDALHMHFVAARRVLEIGSGTGQHAVYFCQRFEGLQWQPTDVNANLTGIAERVSSVTSDNIAAPLPLDVNMGLTADVQPFEMAYSANTAHIMSIEEVASMFTVVGGLLVASGIFALYGPFSENGKHSADSNAMFDQSLRQQAAHMGVRDKIDLQAMARSEELVLAEDIAMPSNNRILLWQKKQ